MPLPSATISTALNVGRDVLAPASIWAGGSAIGAAAGLNPATEAVKLGLGNPLESAQFLFATNPFQSIQATGRYELSRLGMFGYKTLVAGIGPGGAKRTLTAGNLVLSTLQGAARGLHTLNLLGESNLATSLRHARTVGLAGVFNPGAAVKTLPGMTKANIRGMIPTLVQDVKLPRHYEEYRTNIRSALKAGRLSRHTKWRHMAGAGPTTAKDAESFLIKNFAQSVEDIPKGGARVITPVLSESAERAGLYVGKTTKGKFLANTFIRSQRMLLRGFSLYMYGSIASMLARPAVGAMVQGASNLAITSLELLRSVASRDITPAQMSSIFMTTEAATERQRAIQSIYGARVNPSNRLMGNEAQMYHS